MTEKPDIWHHGAIIYQIYPRSFYDGTANGVGNLKGIVDKLDYLGGHEDSLGVTAIWLSPIYTSPMADFGYDIADYCAVDPIFGTLADFKLLVRETHKRGMKIILDLVPNHSSDEHPWFIESCASIQNPKRDWYVWQDPKANGDPPNNWLSVFGDSAWQWSEQTKQYYLHSFLAKQPDLNWDNPAVREAMKSNMRFWLDLGVDGFRIDAVDWLSKDPELRNEPIDLEQPHGTTTIDHHSLRHLYSRDGPHLFDWLNEMTKVLEEYVDRFMITEAHPETDNKIQGYLEYYQSVNPQLSAPFNLEGIHLPWDARQFRQFVDTFQAAMKPSYTPIYTLGNHDESRIASRIGRPAARTAAMLLLTLPGQVFMYYGDELGMTDVAISRAQVRDPFTRPGKGRDPERTPMQWNDQRHAGFTIGNPWLPISPDYRTVNVEAESKHKTSYLNLYKQLIRLRNQSPVLRSGTYQSVDCGNDVFGYYRNLADDTLLILLNFTSETQPVCIKDFSGQILLSTYLETREDMFSEQVVLRPHEGLIIRNLFN